MRSGTAELAPPAAAAGERATAGAVERLGFDFATAAVLWRRELKRLVRQRSRLVGAVAQPFIFWLVIGSGLAGSFRVPGAERVGYLEYFFPGVLAMVVLFTSIFSTMSLIEDRREGFLQTVLAGPGSRSSVAAGKIAGGATVALLQVAPFVAMAPWAGFAPAHVSWGLLVLTLVLASVALTALGFALAWVVDSAQGYHAIMSIGLIPMWVLSGAMFPAAGSSGWLAVVMKVNPMAYVVEASRRALYGGHLPAPFGVAGSALAELAVLGAFAAVAAIAASAVCERR